MSKPAIKLLVIYHQTDVSFFKLLMEHLHFPIQNGTIETIEPIQLSDPDSRNRLSGNLKKADLVVSFLSDSLLKEYGSLKLSLSAKNHSRYILTKPCEWTAHIVPNTILPTNRLPISSWDLEDEAILTITKELLEIASTIEPKTIEQTTTTTLSALEREGLEQQEQILSEKLTYLRNSVAPMAEGSKKFELIKAIEQVEKEVKEIQRKLNS